MCYPIPSAASAHNQIAMTRIEGNVLMSNYNPNSVNPKSVTKSAKYVKRKSLTYLKYQKNIWDNFLCLYQ